MGDAEDAERLPEQWHRPACDLLAALEQQEQQPCRTADKCSVRQPCCKQSGAGVPGQRGRGSPAGSAAGAGTQPGTAAGNSWNVRNARAELQGPCSPNPPGAVSHQASPGRADEWECGDASRGASGACFPLPPETVTFQNLSK